MEAEDYEDDKNESPVKPNYNWYLGVTRRVIDVLLTVLLNIGSKTFTHAFMFIEKYHKVIKTYVTREQDEVEVLHCLFGVWHEQRQMMVVLTDKLIEKEAVTAQAVIYCVFSDEMFSQLNCFYMWAIINGILETASLVENDCWNQLQEIEDSNESEEVKRNYAQSRKKYMDLVIQSLAGIVLRLEQGSTNNSPAKDRASLDLVDGGDGATVNPSVTDETRAWLLVRVENLLLTVDLPHSYVLKQVDQFISKISVPDQFLEIYGVYRVTVKQAS